MYVYVYVVTIHCVDVAGQIFSSIVMLAVQVQVQAMKGMLADLQMVYDYDW